MRQFPVDIDVQQVVLKKLKALKVPVASTTPWEEEVDACIYLGGKYDGISVSCGENYYGLTVELPKDEFFEITGTGDLKAELATALRYNA